MTAALRNALDLFHMPSRVRQARREPLPEGVHELLRIVAGDEGVLQAASKRIDREPGVVRDAATFFIEQMLLTKDADSYRRLGADRDAPMHELRRNVALLLKWLHPDTRAPGGRAALAARVTAAWNDLKTPERRAAYDRLAPKSESTRPRLGKTSMKIRRPGAPTRRGGPALQAARLASAKPAKTLLRRILLALSGRAAP